MKHEKVASLANVFRRLAGWPFRAAAARASLRQLAGMSERELADIGLARQDLRDASALAPREEPWIYAIGSGSRCAR
jgi:uncharacterized protein YjiS (DUF1127 family)